MDGEGGICNVRTQEHLPRKRQQISYLAKSENVKHDDYIPIMMEMAKEDARDFVRNVLSTSEFMVLLSNKQQLSDVERFCTNPGNVCILGVDPTLNLRTAM
jgi:hypothetical protein